MAGISWFYLNDVWAGIRKHRPPCAPIRSQTVVVVYAFTMVGTLVGTTAVALSWRNRPWMACATLAVAGNLAACATWAHWNVHEMLLPYAEFCAKVGMP
jgi:hypothetical protein